MHIIFVSSISYLKVQAFESPSDGCWLLCTCWFCDLTIFFSFSFCSWMFGPRSEKLLDWGLAWILWCLKYNAWINYVLRGKKLRIRWKKSGRRLKSLIPADLNLRQYILPYLRLIWSAHIFNISSDVIDIILIFLLLILVCYFFCSPCFLNLYVNDTYFMVSMSF